MELCIVVLRTSWRKVSLASLVALLISFITITWLVYLCLTCGDGQWDMWWSHDRNSAIKDTPTHLVNSPVEAVSDHFSLLQVVQTEAPVEHKSYCKFHTSPWGDTTMTLWYVTERLKVKRFLRPNTYIPSVISFHIKSRNRSCSPCTRGSRGRGTKVWINPNSVYKSQQCNY